MFTEIDDALDYLYSFIDYETSVEYIYNRMNYNVARTLQLLNLLGNPQRYLNIFHIAGTKGKGTVCYFIESFLRRKGYRTGLFISPHIEKINERISFCNRAITDKELIELVNVLQPVIDGLQPMDRPTTFEILTAMAIYYFKKRGVEYAILETGMGGRLDSTNFCQPVVSVITSIGYDHMDKLGNTIEKITYEKAGIIKPGSPVVLSYQDYGSIVDDCRRISRKLKNNFYYVPDYMWYKIKEQQEMGTIFDLKKENRTMENIFLSLPGEHQINNGLTSIMALEAGGIEPEEREIREVFSTFHLSARVELIKIGDNKIILDSAHNESSARTLINTVKKHFNYRKLVSVVGIVDGKDIFGILSNLAPVSDILIVTNPVTHKPTNPEKVWKKSLMFKSNSLFIPDLEEAVKTGYSLAKDEDIIIITGSFYTVSPAIKILKNLKREHLNRMV